MTVARYSRQFHSFARSVGTVTQLEYASHRPVPGLLFVVGIWRVRGIVHHQLVIRVQTNRLSSRKAPIASEVLVAHQFLWPSTTSRPEFELFSDRGNDGVVSVAWDRGYSLPRSVLTSRNCRSEIPALPTCRQQA